MRPFSIMRMRKAAPPAAGLLADTYADDQIGAPATASFSVDNVGTATGGPTNINGHASYATGYAGAAYDIMAAVTSGAMSTGTTGSWLSMSGTNSWTVARTITGTNACTATFSIRDHGTLTVLSTASISFSATRE